jgi:hypothetical protein
MDEAFDCVGLAPGFGAVVAGSQAMFSVFVFDCGSILLLSSFYALCPRSEEYYRRLQERRFNPRFHIAKAALRHQDRAANLSRHILQATGHLSAKFSPSLALFSA